jgi:Leucine-rich repeat (LRR) protein
LQGRNFFFFFFFFFSAEKLLRTSSSSSLPRASEGSAEVEQITQSESAGMSSSDGNIAIIKTGKQGAFGVALSTVKVRSSSVAAISGSPSSSGPGTPEAVRACSPDSEEGSATAFMVVKKDEESAFPGFKVSTMARRDNAVSKKRTTVADGAVFIPQIKMPSAATTTATSAAQKTSPKTSPRVFSSANRSPRGPKSPRQGGAGGTDVASDDEYEFGETESASAVSQLLDEQQVEPPPPFPDLPEAPPLEMSQDELMDAIAPAARDRLSHSTKTGRLDMSGFLLGFIPSNIPLNIAQLNLAANNISELKAGESLPFLRRLAELDLSFNPLNKFFLQQAEAATKPGLVLPASLTNLSLRNCLLEELPPKSILAQAAQLSGLDIRFNGIKLLSRIPCPQLVEFIANFNLFDTVDAQAFQECRNTLRSVELSNNKIRTLDAAAVTDLSNVERLLLSNNRISALPPTIGQLSSVTTLELSNNMLHSLPSEFGKLRNLRVLRCRGNRIVNVKFSFSDLVNLRLADMSYNQLSEVPDLSGAVNLRTVMLSGNPLFTLSNVEWGKLPLTILICSGTLIEDVPSALLAHRSTEVMYLGYNQKVRTIGSLLLNRTLKILNVSGCGGAEGFVVPPDFVSAEDNSKLISVAAFGASSPGGLSCLRGFGPEVRITVQPKASGSTRAALAETIGLRPAMEDRSVIAESVGPGAATVLCIFDGHGGVNAAEYCSSKVMQRR